MHRLNFRPLPGFTSPHLQTILGAFRRAGNEPPSHRMLVEVHDGDVLSCEISTPADIKEEQPTLVLIHGLGGSHTSRYMVRLSRKFYLLGYRVVRVNLRGCGSGQGLAKLPYYGGASKDILAVLHALKGTFPTSPLQVIGFSLGGNILLKLAGELGKEACGLVSNELVSNELVSNFFAVCPPLDLGHSVSLIERYPLYHSYYLKRLNKQARIWLKKDARSLYEFDDILTAPMWGYSGADEYYKSCSSAQFLPHIAQKCHILFAQDDPFVDMKSLDVVSLPPSVNIFTTAFGGHMGFFGKTAKSHHFFWLDQLLLNWIQADFMKELSH